MKKTKKASGLGEAKGKPIHFHEWVLGETVASSWFQNPETPDGEDLQIPHSASLTSPEAVDERWFLQIGWARI